MQKIIDQLKIDLQAANNQLNVLDAEKIAATGTVNQQTTEILRLRTATILFEKSNIQLTNELATKDSNIKSLQEVIINLNQELSNSNEKIRTLCDMQAADGA
jgi:chromosome segregation ATPase